MFKYVLYQLFILTLLCCSSNYTIIETEFRNGDISFSANIYKPIGIGPFPAVIIVHGSKNHTKDFYKEYLQYFASNGIVCLSFDNRGHGNTNGNLWTSSFQDLASDLKSAKGYLETFDFVNSDKIGFWADSHGAWIALIADSISSNINFIISKSGPSVTPLETINFDYDRNYLTKQNIPRHEKQKILELYPKIFEYLTRHRSEKSWEEISQRLKYFESKNYFNNDFDEYYKTLLKAPNEMLPINKIEIAPSGRDFDFNPKNYLEKVETKMLVIYGTKDKLIPVDDCVSIIKAINNPNITLLIYENADHGIRIQENPDFIFGTRFPDDYFDKLSRFIKE